MSREQIEIEIDNVAKLAAISSLNSLFFKFCKEFIVKNYLNSLKDEFKYDSQSIANKKVLDKRFEKKIKDLKFSMNATVMTLDKIDKSSRNALGNEVIDDLIDKSIKLKELIIKKEEYENS
jgi:hypothetical protein